MEKAELGWAGLPCAKDFGSREGPSTQELVESALSFFFVPVAG